MNLKVSGTLVAISALFFCAPSNAALLLDPYIGVDFGIGAATEFIDSERFTDNARSFGGTIGLDVPIFRIELEYNYMTPQDARFHLGLINLYAKMPTTIIQPYIGAGVGTVFNGRMHDTDIEKITAYQAMLGLTFDLPVIPFKIDVEGRVLYMPEIYDNTTPEPDILQYEGRLKLRYIF